MNIKKANRKLNRLYKIRDRKDNRLQKVNALIRSLEFMIHEDKVKCIRCEMRYKPVLILVNPQTKYVKGYIKCPHCGHKMYEGVYYIDTNIQYLEET